MRRATKLADARVVEITVALWIDEDADVAEVISEMNYEFKHPAIQDTEVRDINTEI
jgi:hypothetical protein